MLKLIPCIQGMLRIIGYLMHELPESRLDDENTVLELHPHKGLIASRLNQTQEYFSRILRELSELGLIKVEGRRILILIPSVDRLHKYQTAKHPTYLFLLMAASFSRRTRSVTSRAMATEPMTFSDSSVTRAKLIST